MPIRTLPELTLLETPTPVYTGAEYTVFAYEVVAGLCTIFLATGAELSPPANISFPQNGMNPGQQVTLWGFTSATFLNGVTATITQNVPELLAISFPVTAAPVGLTDDAGNVAIAPASTYKQVTITAGANSSDSVYVGDGNVSSSRYTYKLAAGAGCVIDGQNTPAQRIFAVGSGVNDVVQVTLEN